MDCYEQRFFFHFTSKSSRELREILSAVVLTLDEKWECLLNFVTDIGTNNGKALFSAIHETAMHFKLNKQNALGFSNLFSFFMPNNACSDLPVELKMIIKQNMIDLSLKEQKEREENPLKLC